MVSLPYRTIFFHLLFFARFWNPFVDLCRLEKSRAQRILWLLEEVKANYDIKTYKRQNMLAPAEFKEVHPLGKAPLISIESETLSKPLVLAESGTIIEYLAENFGPWLIPKQYQDGKEGQIGGETESWLRYRYYMHFAEGSHMPLLLIALLLNSKSINNEKLGKQNTEMSRHQK